MVYIELLIVLLAIFVGARVGGIGLGIFGMMGLGVLVFGFGLTPGNPPIDVMLIIVAVITAAATLQAAGGLDYLVKVAEKILRKNPAMITFLAPVVCYFFTLFSGTGHIAYSLLPIISEIATDSKVRPERPLSISVIASQQAITASPISAATAALLSAELLGDKGVTEYLRRLREGVLDAEGKSEEALSPQAAKRAKTSVIIFLIGVLSIVLFGSIDSLRPTFTVNGQLIKLGMTQVIEIVMMSTAGLMLIFAKTDINKAVKGSVFIAGMQAVIAIFGIAWMGDTFFAGNIEFFKTHIEQIVTQYPFLFSVALFVMSVLLFSQAATVRTLYPLGIALGIHPMAMVAMFPAVNGYFFIPNYPTVVAAINFDRTGTTRIGKYVLNHSFQLPGFVATIVAIAVGYLIIMLM